MENFKRSSRYICLVFDAALDKLGYAARLGGFHWELKVWDPKSGERYTLNGLGHVDHYKPPIRVELENHGD